MSKFVTVIILFPLNILRTNNYKSYKILYDHVYVLILRCDAHNILYQMHVCLYLFRKKAKLTEYLDIHMPIPPPPMLLCNYTASYVPLPSFFSHFFLFSLKNELYALRHVILFSFVVLSHLILYVF